MTSTRQKIGTEYRRSGYGRGKRKANVYLIDGFAYAKDKATSNDEAYPLTGDLEGYVRVNVDGTMFFQVSNHSSLEKHLPYSK